MIYMVNNRMTTKEFKIINPDSITVTKAVDTTDDEALYIKGIANSGLEDRAGDIVTQEALESIVEQAPHRNLHMEHSREIEDIIGTITEARMVPEGVEITARIRNRFKSMMQEFFDDGIKLALSIAGLVEYMENSTKSIVSWDLTEISLVAIPCDANTMETVVPKSLVEYMENLEVKEMAEETITVEQVTDMINDAVNAIKEEYEPSFEEINQKIVELETSIQAIEEKLATPEAAEDEEEEVVEEELEESLEESEELSLPEEEVVEESLPEDDSDELKAITQKLETLDKTIQETVENNLLEFFSKAVNNNTGARQPTFQYKEQAPQDDEEEEILTSKQLAEKIIKGEI